MRHEYDVVVVGAGIAGLSVCAHLPASRKLRVLLLEARDRIGGRAHTTFVGDTPIDLGCSYIHMINGNPLYALAQKLGIEYRKPNYAALAAAAPIQMPDGASLPPERAARVRQLFLRLFFGASERRAQEVDPAPALTEGLGVWLRQRAAEELEPDELPYWDLLARQMSGMPGADLDLVSLRYWGQECGFPGEDVLLTGGYHRIVEHLHDEAQKRCLSLDIALGKVVTGITDDAEHELVRIATADGETISAAHVVMTVPLGCLKHGDVAFSPPLPRRRLHAIASLAMDASTASSSPTPNAGGS